jgi:hypothetical protein
VLELVRLNGVTQVHSLKRKDQAGHVEYWKAQCGESRTLRLEGGKGREALPIPTPDENSSQRTYFLKFSLTWSI